MGRLQFRGFWRLPSGDVRNGRFHTADDFILEFAPIGGLLAWNTVRGPRHGTEALWVNGRVAMQADPVGTILDVFQITRRLLELLQVREALIHMNRDRMPLILPWTRGGRSAGVKLRRFLEPLSTSIAPPHSERQ